MSNPSSGPPTASKPDSLFRGFEIRPYEYLSHTSFAFIDLHEILVSPELHAKLRAAGPGEVEKCFEGITLLDLRKYRECKG